MDVNYARRIVGGGIRRKVRNNGYTRKEVAGGEVVGRRIRRRVGRGWLGSIAEAKEREMVGMGSREVVAGLQGRTRRLVGMGRRVRVGRKGYKRENRKAIGTEGYWRRIGRGRNGLRRILGSWDRLERYLGVERLSLTRYVRVGFRRGSGYSTEAGRKYYRVGAIASSRRVVGRVRVYGATGTLKVEERERRRKGGVDMGQEGRRGRSRVRWVRRFKLGVVPLHRWVADVYEGAPTIAVRYMRMAPKRALVLWVIRVARRMEGDRADNGVVSWARGRRGRRSVRVGGLGIRVQLRWKRYLAYSGIANVGMVVRGGSIRTGVAREAMRWVRMAYRIIVWNRWGGLISRNLGRSTYAADPKDTLGVGEGKSTKGRPQEERKYRTERIGLAKNSRHIAGSRGRARWSGRGRPPRVGFGGKAELVRSRASAGRKGSSAFWRELGGRILLGSVIAGFGYRRRRKRRYVDVGGQNERRRRESNVGKEYAVGMARSTLRRLVGWVSGTGIARVYERRVVKWRI